MQFAAIHGQSLLKNKLTQGATAGRVSHAQLFIGPEGCGNLAMAWAYAQFLLCEKPTENDSCGACPSCRKMSQLIHPDLHFSFPVISGGDTGTCADFVPQFRKALAANHYVTYKEWMQSIKAENKQGNIPIKECHAIIKSLSLTAYEGKYKILMMWLPEYLGKEGNALLKLLEEPPPNTVFLLVAHKEAQILTTILSRMVTIRVPPFFAADLEQELIENHHIEPVMAKQFALMADGNVNRAIGLSTENESYFFEPFRKWLQHCYKRNTKGMDDAVTEIAALGREQSKSFLEYGLQVARGLAVFEHLGPEGTHMTDLENGFISNLSNLFNHDKVEKMNSMFNKSIYDIERNGNAKLVLFDLSLGLKNLFYS